MRIACSFAPLGAVDDGWAVSALHSMKKGTSEQNSGDDTPKVFQCSDRPFGVVRPPAWTGETLSPAALNRSTAAAALGTPDGEGVGGRGLQLRQRRAFAERRPAGRRPQHLEIE